MKTFVLMLLMTLAASSWAEESVCRVDLQQLAAMMMNPIIPQETSVVALEVKYQGAKAELNYINDKGEKAPETQEVISERFQVRDNLQFDLDRLNKAEQVIAQAMMLTTDPGMSQIFQVDLDLTKIRSVKLFTIGKDDHYILETFDSNGKELGRFMGGRIVMSCQG